MKEMRLFLKGACQRSIWINWQLLSAWGYNTEHRIIPCQLQRKSVIYSTKTMSRHSLYEGSRRYISSRRHGDLITQGVKRDEMQALQSEDVVAEALERHLTQISTDIRRKGRINSLDLKESLSLLEKGANMGEHGTFLLKCCTRTYLPDIKPDEIVQLFQKFWSAIEREGRKSQENFEVLLQCYTDNSFIRFDPWEILEDCRGLNITKSRVGEVSFLNKLYYLALLSYCQRGDLKNAVKLLQLVKTEGFLVDESYFTALLLGNSRAGDFSSAKEIIGIMKSSHVMPSLKTFTALMQACIEHNDIDMLYSAYNMCKRDAVITEHEIIELATTSIFNGNLGAFEQILKWLPGAHRTSDSLITFNLIVGVIHRGFPNQAKTILSHWARGIHLTRNGFGVSFVKELVYANVETAVLVSLCNELKVEGHNPYALHSAAEFSLRKKRFELALMLFNLLRSEKSPLRPHYFWPMLIHDFKTEGLTGLTKSLQSMISFGVLPDWDTYTEHVVPQLFSVERNPVQVAKILKDSAGLSYSSGSFNAILHYLLKHNRLTDASSMARKLRGDIQQPTIIVDILFRSLLHVESRENISSNVQLTLPILKSVYQEKPSSDKTDYVGKFILRFYDSIGFGMPDLTDILILNIVKEQIPISESVAEMIEMKIRRKCAFKVDKELTHVENSSYKLFTHPREMDTKALECHTEELQAKEMNTRGALRLLFIKLCQDNELAKALEVKAEFEKLGGLSPGMKGALFGVYVRMENLEVATKLYKELTTLAKTTVDWSMDIHKLLDLVTLMAKHGKREDAFALLMKDGLNYPTPENGNQLTRNVVKMLEAFDSSHDISDSDGIAQVLLETLDFVLKNQLIAPSSPVLSVVIKHFVSAKKIEKALGLFEEYAKTYKLTPGNQLLAYSVLKDKVMLERYMNACTSVHGATSAKYQLAYSLSDLGHTHDASKIFSELGKRLDVPRILKQCEYLADRKEIPKILNLIKSLVTSRRDLNTSNLYMIALKSCQRHQDRVGLRLILDIIENDLSVSLSSTVLRYVKDIKAQLGVDV